MSVLLAVDVGTTNWKVAAFDLNGKAVCIEKISTITHYDENNHSTYKPSEIWNGIAGLIQKVVSQVDEEIVGISATSMAEAVVPIDADGNECFDIITWFDTRSYKEAEELVSTIGKEKLYEITGLDPNPIFSICKMLWMKKNNPEVYKKSVKWLQMTDYIIYKLTGEYVTDYTLASRTLAFDVAKNKWSDEILNTMGVDKKLLPTIVESGTAVGTITPEAAKETGLSVGLMVAMGGNDHPCAALPAGVLNGNKILDSSGTAESIIFVSQPKAEPKMVFEGQRTCRFLSSERYALWGGIVSSGASFEWAYQLLTSVESWGLTQSNYDYADIIKKMEDVPIGSNGLLFLPHLRGSGAPYWNPKMKGSLLGIKSTTTPQEILRAVVEGLSFQARMIVEMQEKLSGTPAEALCVVGGSGKNWVWQQIKADVLQKNIEICSETDATALGAAMLAGVGAGVFESMEGASQKVATGNRIITPNIENKEKYDTLYALYVEAYDVTVGLSEKLNDLKL